MSRPGSARAATKTNRRRSAASHPTPGACTTCTATWPSGARTSTSKDYYKKSPKADPPGPAKNENGGMVVRGGCWRDDVGNCRSASRRDYAPNTAAVSVGFRVVMRGP